MINPKITTFCYKNVFKPILFLTNPEKVHGFFTFLGALSVKLPFLSNFIKFVFAYENPSLVKEIAGIKFSNPVGLSAGFDYDGKMAGSFKNIGFGFNTVGTVTALPYEGNTGPRLKRLKESQSILVNKGFKSSGADKVREILEKQSLEGKVIGLSVGSTNIPEVDTSEKAINDYFYTFDLFKEAPYISYFELNISCPNACMSESFTAPKVYRELLTKISTLKLTKPIFVKMPSELSPEKTFNLLDISLEFGINSFIFSNLVKNREDCCLNQDEMLEIRDLKGNFSGKPVAKHTNKLLKEVRAKYGNKVNLIGVGGVFGYEDAKQMLESGADLIQLITGMIYNGPQIMGEINQKLSSKTIYKTGYKSVEAIPR